jgi:hypothetical protein
MVLIEVRIGPRLLMKGKFIMLEPYAPDTTRQIIFSDVHWLENNKDPVCDQKLNIVVSYLKKNGEWGHYTEFKINLLESHGFGTSEWRVSCFISQDDEDKVYRQGITDIFKLWQEEKNISWFSLPEAHHLKADYISACLFYTGISDSMVEREVYEIDMSLVNEEQDFLYLAGLAFIGDRGYLGRDLFTFNDCLLTIFHKRGAFFDGLKVVFLNTKNLSQTMLHLYGEIRSIFIKFKFEVLET